MNAQMIQRWPSLWRILRAPLWIALVSFAGLAAALLGDGWWHMLAWLLLAIPVLFVVTALVRR